MGLVEGRQLSDWLGSPAPDPSYVVAPLVGGVSLPGAPDPGVSSGSG